MKRGIVCGIAVIVTATAIAVLTSSSDIESVSAVSELSKREIFEQRTRAGVERNKVLQIEQSTRQMDPSITDEVALGLLLRFISGNQNEQQRVQVRRYMSEILGVTGQAGQDKVFAVGDAYRLESNQIQMQSEATTQKYHPSHNTISQQDRLRLIQLAESKKRLIRDSERILRQQLSSAEWASIQTALASRIKPRVRVSNHQQ